MSPVHRRFFVGEGLLFRDLSTSEVLEGRRDRLLKLGESGREKSSFLERESVEFLLDDKECLGDPSLALMSLDNGRDEDCFDIELVTSLPGRDSLELLDNCLKGEMLRFLLAVVRGGERVRSRAPRLSPEFLFDGLFVTDLRVRDLRDLLLGGCRVGASVLP